MTEEEDPERTEKIIEGCQVYAQAGERAKQGERTISMDELTGVQALERKHPDLPMQPGHVLPGQSHLNKLIHRNESEEVIK